MKKTFFGIMLIVFIIIAGRATAGTSYSSDGLSGDTQGARLAYEFGMVCDGSTDDTAAFNTALEALYDAGGGTLVLPSICLIKGQVILPNNGDQNRPEQPSIRITGTGSATGLWASDFMPHSGLDLRSDTPPAKILTLGAGKFEMDHLTLVDNGSDSNAFLFTTNTVLSAHDLTIQGTASGQRAVNDAIILGGSRNFWISNTTATSFSGYGTVIKDIVFHKIRRGVVGQFAANNIIIRDNTFTSECGNVSGGAIEFHGYSANGDGGNLIEGNLIEVINYKYGMSFTNSTDNQLISNSCWDAVGFTTACINFETGTARNTVIPGLYYGTLPVSDSSGATGTNSNFVVSAGNSGNYTYSSNTSVFSFGNTYRPNSTGTNIFAIGPSAATSNTSGSYLLAIGPDALLSNTDGNSNTAIGINTLHWNTHGSENNAVGINALAWNTTGNHNTAFGAGALQRNTTHSNNVAVGTYTLGRNDADNNVGIGMSACANNVGGSRLVCVGQAAGNANTTGNDNVSIGYWSFLNNKTGSNNTGIGSGAGFNNTGSGNVFLGYNAGYSETGSNKLYISNSGGKAPLVYGEFDRSNLIFNGSVTIAPSSMQPACSAATRFMFYTVAGGHGTKDSVQVCAKDATDKYAWRTLY